MVAGAHSRKTLEHKIRCARVVQAWKKRSKKTRCSVAKLAASLGLTRSKTQKLIDSRPKEQDVTREKIRVIREAARRVAKPVRRRETATKLAKECKVAHLAPRTVRKLRQPYRNKERAIKKAQIDENKRRADLSQGYSMRNVVLGARFQGW